MQNKRTHWIVSLLLIVLLTFIPTQIKADGPIPPKNDSWVALCIVAGVGLALTGIYLVSKKCQPRYYWLMDDDDPPKFWVATATRKECSINNWKRIGGPYNSPQEAPAQHPNPTNRVNDAEAALPVTITVQQSHDLVSWTDVYTERCDLEDFAYFPTNAALFRLKVSP